TTTLLESIALLAEALAVEPVIDWRPSRRGDQRHTFGNSSRAARDFGYAPRVRPREGLALQARWHRAERKVPRLRWSRAAQLARCQCSSAAAPDSRVVTSENPRHFSSSRGAAPSG